jgi:biopolymer transport protein ExbB/biopolymer transport protein TolQ
MGLFARLIVVALGIMSVVSLLVTAERILFFRKQRADSIRYATMMERLLGEGRLLEAAQLSAGAGPTGGYLGRVIQAGLHAFTRAQGARGEYIVESVGRALERQAQREIQTLKRGQSIVATVSSTAPFVGLLGTVIGIVTSFQAMASTGSGGLGTVSGGIAEALVTTAFGLLVAIPAVFAYNYLQSWVDARGVDLSESSNELLDTVARGNGVSIDARQFLPKDLAAMVPASENAPQSAPQSGHAPPFTQEQPVATTSGFMPRQNVAIPDHLKSGTR